MLLTKAIQQLTPFWSVVGLSRGEREGDGRSSIRGNHMNLGGPTAAGSADGLGVFFLGPRPVGMDLDDGCPATPLRDTHDCSRCKCSKTRSAPRFDQRFMRV